MNETNSTVSSQTVSSVPLDTANSDTSLAPSSSLASDSSSVVTSDPAADSSSVSMAESTSISIDVSSLPQSVASSMSISTSTSTGSTPDAERFLTKPINDYTPTEGFLFLLVLLAFAALVLNLFKLWRLR